MRGHRSLLFWSIVGVTRGGTIGSNLDRQTSPAECGATSLNGLLSSAFIGSHTLTDLAHHSFHGIRGSSAPRTPQGRAGRRSRLTAPPAEDIPPSSSNRTAITATLSSLVGLSFAVIRERIAAISSSGRWSLPSSSEEYFLDHFPHDHVATL